jgi:prepilin-type N-terminal cleavage/methylation domain-containing protein
MNHTNRGFTLIEVLIVVAIMGMLILISYPSIMNSLETRGLENTARDIQSSMQIAKFQAVKTRINHRIRFSNTTGPWFFAIERQAPNGTWATMHGSIPKSISGKFTVTLNLPAALPAGKTVTFSAMGMISDFVTTLNSIVLESAKLKRGRQPDQRTIIVYAGGSLRYLKSTSG